MAILTGSSQKIHPGHATLQYLAAFACNLNIIASGMHYGWPSPSLPKLQSDDSPISVSNSQGSWIAVMPLLGALLGATLAGTTVDILGRKRTIIVASFPFFAAWIMVAYAKTVLVIYVARFMAGVADGWVFTATPMYIGEISEPRIRGMLGSSLSVNWIFGILLINIIGSYLSIATAALIASVLPVAALLTVTTMPESPYYHVMRKNATAAKNSLQRLRGVQDVEVELDRVTLAVKEQTENSGKFLDLFTNKANRKAVYVMLVLRGAQQLSGTTAVTFYTQQIFGEAGSNISSDLASMIYFFVQLCLACVCSGLVDKAGRRPLLMASILGSAVALAVQGTYFLIKSKHLLDTSSFSFVPVVSLIGFVVAFSLGMQCIPMLMIGELFPANVKAFALCLADMYFALIAAGVSKFFQIVTDSFGMYVPFYCFTVSCLVGFIFIYFFAPETKGKTLEDIQRYLKGEGAENDS